jgi:glycosyltransferase involved in cell wall biosynthesis
MKLSVLLPTRNRLDLLSRAIETVRRQDYDNWEVIISDNFSEEDVAGYIQSLGDSRIKYFRTESFVPVTDNWNNALDKCDGEYVIMLGDDDCLMQGYFSTLSRLIGKFNSPDFVYTNAFLYAYPGVIPSNPDGFLRTYSRRKIFQSASEPFWLNKDDAMEFVKDSLGFRLTFDYNMQFSLVSRKLIEEVRRYGPVFQSPYPDYYATNAMMLKAERILVVPQPLVTIGISPKSFGFYYFNDAESEGNEFLNNLPDQVMVRRLQEVILPGTAMNTSWLISMETLTANFADEFDIEVNYARYRLIQTLSIYSGLIVGRESATKASVLLREKMRFGEWLRYGLMLYAIAKIAPKRYRTRLFFRVQAASGSHPDAHMPTVEGKFNTILDVFEQVDPKRCEESISKEFMENG